MPNTETPLESRILSTAHNMKQAIFKTPFTIEYKETNVPKINEHQVLLRVKSIGVCGSDIQMYHGLHKYMTYPVIPGHEVAAVVKSVGSSVTGFSVGQRVTVEPQVFCGTCYPCKIGRFNVCENLKVKGVHTNGFAAEYVAIEAEYLHLCPDDMPFDLIALVEPLAVGVGAVKRSKYQDANIAVIGAGTIGNLTAQAAQALGAKRVLITDYIDSKLEYATNCGIEYCVNTSGSSLKEAIEQTFGERKADVIIDCAATKGSFQSAIDASRPSSEIIITGNFKVPIELEPPQIQRREISIIGHMMYVREDFADSIAYLANGKINVDGFITQRYGFDKFADAFGFIDENPNDVMKALIEIANGPL